MRKILILTVALMSSTMILSEASAGLLDRLKKKAIDRIEREIEPSYICVAYPNNGFGPYEGRGMTMTEAEADAVDSCFPFCKSPYDHEVVCEKE